jgi:phosphonopyruvate decarboxylase
VLDTHKFGVLLRESGFSFASGVPCSLLKDFINYSNNHFQYVIATNEGEAVAISAGAYLGGKKSLVIMQNSGLTNALNPLTSLNYPFRVPVLGFVSWRGEPGIHDEPEHWLTGEITKSLLDLCKIPSVILSNKISEAEMQLEDALEHFNKDRPFFFIVKKGTFASESLGREIELPRYTKKIINGTKQEPRPSRLQVLEKVSSFKDNDTVLLASTGKCGRELFEIEDSPHNLYMIGSMGCVSSIGLGICLVRPKKRVICLDGDGALLMRTGSLATNGFYRPKNLLHILLDNESHDSTGGQDTVSGNVDFSMIARASGYERSITVNKITDLGRHIEHWKSKPILTLIHVKISKGSKKNLGRPTVLPYDVKKRFMAFIRQ